MGPDDTAWAGGAVAAVTCRGAGGGATCGGAGTVNVGLTDVDGTTNRGGGAVFEGAGAGALAAGGADVIAADFVSTGRIAAEGRAGAAAGAAGCCLLMIAFRTSPGLEM